MDDDEYALYQWQQSPKRGMGLGNLRSNPAGRLLASAVDSKRCVEIAYQDADGSETDRRIGFLDAFTVSDSAYIRAYCFLRKEERTFRLDRIRSVRISEEEFDRLEYLRRTYKSTLVESPLSAESSRGEPKKSSGSVIFWVIVIACIAFWLLFKK
jgi:hypothetical protein